MREQKFIVTRTKDNRPLGFTTLFESLDLGETKELVDLKAYRELEEKLKRMTELGKLEATLIGMVEAMRPLLDKWNKLKEGGS